jgi:ATP synthase protein I
MGDDLNERIARARETVEKRQRPAVSQTGRGMGLGMRMASDFVAAVIVGAVLGWGIDALFHVSPWGLIVCLLLGFVTGVRNVVRAAKNSQTSAGNAGPDGGPSSLNPAPDPANDKDGSA